MTERRKSVNNEADGLSQYIRELRQNPETSDLLSREQVTHYAQIIRQAKNTIQSELCSDTPSQAVIAAATSEKKAAIDILTMANLRLVIPLAKKKLASGLPYLDLIQEGNLGVMHAAENFDPEQARFSTYATWWINQAMDRAIANKVPLIRKPVHVVETIKKVSRVRHELLEILDHEPTLEEISQRFAERYNTTITAPQIAEMMHHNASVLSLSEPAIDGDLSLEDTIEDKGLNVEEMGTRKLRYQEVERLLKSSGLFTPKELNVLQLRCEELTLKEIGKEIKATREWARQILLKVCKKISDNPDLSQQLHFLLGE